MAGEEDEDYMGDLSQFLPPDVPQSSSKKVSSSNLVESKSSSKKPKFHNWQEQKKLDRKRKQIEEDKQTLENIGSAIPQSNIGFKLLKQMGYTPGSALGKEGSGRVEPVSLEIRRGRAGIGTEDPEIAKMRRERAKVEMNKRNESELMEIFGSHQKERWKGRRIVVNFQKADAALAQLENRDDYLGWHYKQDIMLLNLNLSCNNLSLMQDLLNILMKLRNEFNYCLFCGCQYETMEALESNCPGINEDDH
ncbi:D111/G-patch domain-containing protein [Perilla frutescens var. hirtella]|uniref:D111/G-patch domain-containing protein n=1 Tax=Perilla frutescens var. hirtella TaxID=608512 RepID=A0AAD4P9W2_PERFH|nr:D111/G-patch domain-containing protein [Perilla frutescens var. frutescens]KAH6812840.1 D111/G-patch domain-containing protein [Perilla frutescens var. frutescens]KAH6831310.1 D111/G-patch domain-containing protein [Perilla frutescens var. hirtella]